MNINDQEKFIEEYLGLGDKDPVGGMFMETISLEQLKTLLDKAPDFIKLDKSHNYSPTVEQFIKFGEKNDKSVFETYIFLPKHRDDYRITVTAVLLPYTEKNVNKIIDWIGKCKLTYPDEFGEVRKQIRAWWD